MRWNHVALLAEGVDRNFALYRAGPATAVALLAEGVDRNFRCFDPEKKSMASPSSRRAWIEIRHT